MKDFLKGLLALPLVLIGGFTVYWVGAILLAVVGGIIGLVVVLAPYVLRFVGIVLIIVSRFGALENWSHVPSAVQKMTNSESWRFSLAPTVAPRPHSVRMDGHESAPN